MFSSLRSYRPGHGTLVAYLALFVALGGTSYGVATGSIDGREIKNNSVGSKDLRNNDIRSRDVRNGALLSADFKAGQLPAGARGATGPPGPQGARGPAGAPGRDGFGPPSYFFTDDKPLPANGSAEVLAECGGAFPGDGAPSGGGATVYDTQGTADINDDVEITNGEMDLNRSRFVQADGFAGTNAGWESTVSNLTGETDRVAVGIVACMSVDSGAFRTRNDKRR